MSDPFAEYNEGVRRARREYAARPIVFAIDELCETCQVKDREGTSRKCSGCRHIARLESKRRYDRKKAREKKELADAA